MEVNLQIFKKYDIRGIYPDEINDKAVYDISRAFADFIKNFYQKNFPKIVIGRDIRSSSEELAGATIRGLTEAGAEAIDTGLTSTPLNYFGNWFLGADGSVMITASHNPKEYNGMKFSLKEVIGPAEIGVMEKIKELALKGEFQRSPKGKVIKKDILPDYLRFLKEKAAGVSFDNFRIAVDCGNGMIGPEFEKLAKILNWQYRGLFMEPDGNFPNHQPDPLNKDAQKPLQALMARERFDLGVIFDGDGDRLGVLDHQGNLIRTDLLIGLFAKQIILEAKGKKIPCDFRVSKGVREEVKKLGGEIIKSPVGYPNLRKIMREEKAFFGGELSGHFFWQDFSYAESALLSLLRLLKILEQEDKPIEELVKPFQKYFSSGEINFQVTNKEKILKKAEEEYRQGEVSYLDGITVEFEDWWFNLRPSGTEPLLRMIVEAESEKLLAEKVRELKEFIQQ